MSRTRDEIYDELQKKIKTLNESIWERRADWPTVRRWLSQFRVNERRQEDEQLHALFLLSHFLYFGANEIRALLKSLFRDHVDYRITTGIRKALGNTLDRVAIGAAREDALRRTRFVALGNPSESSAMMLYYFRQENNLPKSMFANAVELFSIDPRSGQITGVSDPSITNYVFVDDLCASGSQAVKYSNQIVTALKNLQPGCDVCYYALFALQTGMQHIKRSTAFDVVDAVVEIDETFRCFSDDSRIYKGDVDGLDRDSALKVFVHYGEQLWREHPLGWEDGQLAIGFSHNTPDNSLPIFWADSSFCSLAWMPLFKRYPKVDW